MKKALAAAKSEVYKNGCELRELRRKVFDESTGLRSETKLNTPRTRCESVASR
jgi:hypothetical protein